MVTLREAGGKLQTVSLGLNGRLIYFISQFKYLNWYNSIWFYFLSQSIHFNLSLL